MNDELITVADAAEELGKDKKHVFKVLNRLNIERSLQRSESARGQKVACITRSDLERVREHFAAANVSEPTREGNGPYIDSESTGVFYLIQLEPELDPGRFKLGFATNIDERLRSHRTAAPMCRVLQTWPCRLLWEKTAIEFITPECERLHTEVFRAATIESITERCEKFISLAPLLTQRAAKVE